MSHRVDATVEEVKASCIDCAIDRTRSNPGFAQLPTCHDTMLRLCNPRDCSISSSSP